MPTLIKSPTIVEAAGNKPKRIEEFIGRVNSSTSSVSVARMNSPAGWTEPGQRPEFDEYTLVLRGTLRVASRDGAIDVSAGEAVIAHRGEWVQYSTPGDEGAEYIAVCLPAFSPETVHRNNDADTGSAARETAAIRKRIVDSGQPSTPRQELDVSSCATVLVTSESVDHPIDHAFDTRRGPGGSRWVAREPGEQTLTLAFDAPQDIRRVVLEIEEPEVQRTQELELAVSSDGGRSYREILRQEYNFSPPGTSFEREEWTVAADAVTHLRLGIRPDKGGKPCRATVTSLVLL